MAWERQSPGVYKNTVTGEVRRSATKPTDSPASKAPAPAASNPAIEAARANLAQQVASGGISQAAMDAELNYLKSINYNGSNDPRVASNPQQISIPQKVGPALSLQTPADVINTGSAIAKDNTTTGNQLTNPNQKNPFGSQTVTYDKNGTPTVTQNLSKANEQILSGVQQGSVNANEVLNALMKGGVFGSLTNPSASGGPAPQSNFESAVFEQLTRDLDKNKARDSEQLSQTLANRGIPVGSELYNNQMRELNDYYGNQLANARSTAVTQGTNTALSSLPVFSSLGQSGFMTPSFQGFQSTPYQGVNIQDLFGQLQNYSLGQQQLQSNKEIAGMKNSGGGSFNFSAPPQSNWAFNA